MDDGEGFLAEVTHEDFLDRASGLAVVGVVRMGLGGVWKISYCGFVNGARWGFRQCRGDGGGREAAFRVFSFFFRGFIW